ncbi:MAG TPA: sensor domain-containing diguanylate cyclase [Gammaproteobacteria bacterium]|nr:sensor domain-containing diguanylate cyclase [Gammaproteobacteria bacterium]
MLFMAGWLLAVILLVMATLFLYLRESARTSTLVRFRAMETAALLRQQFATMDSLLFSLRNELQSNIKLAERGFLKNPSNFQLHEISDLSIFSIGELAQPRPVQSLSGTLTGSGRLADLPKRERQEISAVLQVDGLFKSTLASLPQLKWVYYTSAQRFIYIAPKVSVRVYAFNDALYRKEFWTAAIPQADPQQRTVITRPYTDAYGKELMISLSIPVYVENKFRGVASLGLRLNTLQQILRKENEPYILLQLLDRQQHLLVDSNGDFGSPAWDLPSSDFVSHAVSDTRHGQYHYILPVSSDGLWQVAEVYSWKLFYRVLWSMLPGLLVLLALALLLWLLYRLRQANHRITKLSQTDYLTGISNRRAFWSLAGRILERQVASGMDHENVFIMIDIDHFKSINDHFGHPVGDQVLQRVVAAILAVTRTRDLLCRLGGEEFGLMLPDSSVSDCQLLAERLRRQVEVLEFPELEGLRVTISLGGTAIAAHEGIDDFLKRADKAMYEAKKRGRNRVVFAVVGEAGIIPVVSENQPGEVSAESSGQFPQ